MRDSIGGTWLIQLMILFILLFAAYIILTINYSKTVKLKNESISIIEKYQGLNETSITLVNNFLTSSSYAATGGCGSGSGIYGATSLESNSLEKAQSSKKYYYCIKKYKGKNETNYYQITVFYKFDLPVLGSISSFTIKGSTSSFISADGTSYTSVVS